MLEADWLKEILMNRTRTLVFALAAILVVFSASSIVSNTLSAQTPPQATPQTAPDQSTPQQASPAAQQAPPAAQQAADPTTDPNNTKKPKNKKEDVDEIGSRDVGKGMNWFSLEKEIAIGKAMAQQVEAQSRMVDDPVISEYVNRLGQNLVRNSDAKVPFTIKVIDADEVNAFALPGGFFFVNTGVIMEADEEAELAGVMAHEIAHVAARHGTRGQTRAEAMSIARLALIFVPGMGPYIAYQASGFAIPMSYLKFSQGFEREADYLGLQYMYKAGYDPQAFVTFFEKIQAKEKRKPGTFSKMFGTHPPTPDRISATQKEIAAILPGRPEHIVTTSEFDEVKSRLEVLHNRRKSDDRKGGDGRPTLRRTSTASDSSTTDSSTQSTDKTTTSTSGDDRPTLKRRDP
jgi:beta-barrel assembly-enhancing protease